MKISKEEYTLLLEQCDNEIANIETMLLNEGIINTILSPFLTAFNILYNGIKGMFWMVIRGTRLDKLGNHILNILKDMTIMRKIINRSEEEKIASLISKQAVGDTITDVNRSINFMSGILWKCMTFNNNETLANFWKGVLSPTTQYITFIQELFKNMIDSGVPARYAKAYLVMLFFRRPMYIMWYNWKSFNIPFLAKRTETTEQSMDDQMHLLTAGDTERNQEGLSKADQIMEEKCRKLITIAQNVNLTEFQKNTKLSGRIAWESIGSALIPFFLIGFKIFRVAFGIQGNNYESLNFVESLIKNLILIYYFYFLVAGLMLNSIAIKQEERFHPNDDTDENVREEGALKLNDEAMDYYDNYGIDDFIQFHRHYNRKNNDVIYEGMILDKARQWQSFKLELDTVYHE